MRWTNYHGHSYYCDGVGAPRDYVLKAIEKNMSAIGFSSHAPVPFSSSWNMKSSDLPLYINDINALKDEFNTQIDILLSLEIDYIPNVIGPSDELFKSCGLDYTIGSVHFMDLFPDGTPWGIDGHFDEFMEGYNSIFKGDAKALVKRYYELVQEMVVQHHPDIIGHIDKIKMHNKANCLFDEREDWYQELLYSTLECISINGGVVEINTKAYETIGHLYPGIDSFSTIKHLQIPVTINSDVHHPDKMLVGFDYVAEQLKTAGFNQLVEYRNEEWQLCGCL